MVYHHTLPPSTLKSLDTYTVAITPPPPRYVYVIHDSSLPSLGMHTPYMYTPPPLPVCVSRACRGVLSRVPSHVYVFSLTVVTCPLTSVTCDFFFNLAGRMHDLGVYEKQKKVWPEQRPLHGNRAIR